MRCPGERQRKTRGYRSVTNRDVVLANSTANESISSNLISYDNLIMCVHIYLLRVPGWCKPIPWWPWWITTCLLCWMVSKLPEFTPAFDGFYLVFITGFSSRGLCVPIGLTTTGWVTNQSEYIRCRQKQYRMVQFFSFTFRRGKKKETWTHHYLLPCQ